MADGSVQVVLTNRAKADYASIAEGAKTCLQRVAVDQGPLMHFGRARSILRSLKNPGAVRYDQPMINMFSWMLSRSEETTYVYYGRNISTSQVIIIHICEGTTDIYRLLAEIVFSGQTEVLSALGINPPPISDHRRQLTIH